MSMDDARAHLRRLDQEPEIRALRERIAAEVEFDPARIRSRLRTLLRTAARGVPRYHAIGAGGSVTLSDFPYVTKGDLRRDMASFVSRGTNGVIGGGELVISQTSGSTGEPISVIMSRATGRLANWISTERYNVVRDAPPEGISINVGLHPDRTPMFQASPLPRPYLKVNLPGFNAASESIVEKYRATVGMFDVDKIMGTSSRVLALAEYCLDRGIKLRPSVVQASYESMPDAARPVIQEAFGRPVSMIYMTAETGHAAWECDEGNMHFHNDLVVPELRRGEPGETGDAGEIVLTSLLHTVMPMIRYVTGDLARDFITCTCPQPGTVMSGLLGRSATALVGADGSVFSPWVLQVAMASFGLTSYQIVQDHPGVVNLICPGQPSLARDVAKELNERLSNRLTPQERFRIEVTPSAPFVTTNLGKRNPVVQRLDVATAKARTQYLVV